MDATLKPWKRRQLLVGRLSNAIFDGDHPAATYIADVDLFQNCLHRRKNKGIMTIYATDATTPVSSVKIPHAQEVSKQR